MYGFEIGFALGKFVICIYIRVRERRNDSIDQASMRASGRNPFVRSVSVRSDTSEEEEEKERERERYRRKRRAV